MSRILDPNVTIMRFKQFAGSMADVYYSKNVGEDEHGRKRIKLEKHVLLQRTIFYDSPGNKTNVQRPFLVQMVTRNSTWSFATFDAADCRKHGRSYINLLGGLCIQHGQTYPTNGLQWQDHTNMDGFVRILVVTCKGFTMTQAENGEMHIVLDQATAFSFQPNVVKHADESQKDYEDKVWKDCAEVWQKEFQTNPKFDVESKPVGHSWNTPAFLAKFTYTRSLVLSEAYTTDLSLVTRVAEDFPESGLAQFLPSKFLPSKKQNLSEQPPQQVQAPLVRLVHPVSVAAPQVPAALVVPVAAPPAPLTCLVPPRPALASLLPFKASNTQRMVWSKADVLEFQGLQMPAKELPSLSEEDMDFFV